MIDKEYASDGLTSDAIYAEAKRFMSMGLSIIPICGKRPAGGLKWVQYQNAPADSQQVGDWFALRDDLGIGIVLGKVSGHLVVRDFDKAGAYEAWAEQHPHLAATLPTVRTWQGFHVYARIPNAKFRNHGDGELRTEGHYVVAPPSLHPNGIRYEWIRRFGCLDDVPELSFDESGFGNSYAPKTERNSIVGAVVPTSDKNECTEGSSHTTDNTDRTDNTDITEQTLSYLCLSVVDDLIGDALPLAIGQRVRQLFRLARRVRDHELRTKSKVDYLPLLQRWHQKALPNIGTKSFDQTRADFIAAYKNVDDKLLEDPVFAAMGRSLQRSDPVEAAVYHEELTRSLVRLCLELSQASPDGKFFLSCRKAAEALGVADFKSINLLLNMLVFDGILLVVKKGGPETNRATRYEYIGRSRQVRSDGLNSIAATPE